jgi:hypothetical protein
MTHFKIGHQVRMLLEAPQNQWWLQGNSIERADSDAMSMLIRI